MAMMASCSAAGRLLVSNRHACSVICQFHGGRRWSAPWSAKCHPWLPATRCHARLTGPADDHVDGLTRFGWCSGQPVGVCPAQAVEDRSGNVGSQVTRMVEGLKELLSVDPLLGEDALLVQPDRDRSGARP